MPPKCLKLPKPQSSAKKSRGKSNHKGDHLQLWSVENMRNTLVLYFSQRAQDTRAKCMVINMLQMLITSLERLFNVE